MNKREELIELYDIYKGLLTDKQREYFEEYYFEDLSLTEISENYKVSKAIVSKTINIVEEKLLEIESILNINKKTKDILDVVKDEKLKEQIENILYK